MIDIDTNDITKAELKDFVRKHREDVEALQDVALSQNKTPLVESIEEALSAYLSGLAEVPKDGIIEEVPALSLSEKAAGGGDEAEETTSDDTTATEDEGDDGNDGEDPGAGVRPLANHRV